MNIDIIINLLFVTRVMRMTFTTDNDFIPQDDLENLLSYKINNLNLHSNQAKFLTIFQETHPTINSLGKQLKSNPPPIKTYSSSEKVRTNSTRKNNYLGKKPGTVNLAQRKKEGYLLDDARIFQIGESKNGRKAALTEIKNARLSTFSGRALAVFPNNKKYQGDWADGNLIGEAKISYPNGNIYVGPTYNFLRHGKGYLYFATGQKYIGQFGSGDFHGQGTLYNKKGEILYEGEWRRGKKQQK